jgi:hypothetical protein
MPDVENRFWWAGPNGAVVLGGHFKDFQAASGETGTISQTYPSTEDWRDLSILPRR